MNTKLYVIVIASHHLECLQEIGTPAQSPARKPAGPTHAAGRKRPGRPKAASAQTADRRKRQAAQTADRELILLACEFEPAKCMMRPNACNARVQASLSSAQMPGLNTQGSHAEAFLDRPGFDRPPENENALQATAIYCARFTGRHARPNDAWVS